MVNTGLSDVGGYSRYLYSPSQVWHLRRQMWLEPSKHFGHLEGGEGGLSRAAAGRPPWTYCYFVVLVVSPTSLRLAKQPNAMHSVVMHNTSSQSEVQCCHAQCFRAQPCPFAIWSTVLSCTHNRREQQAPWVAQACEGALDDVRQHLEGSSTKVERNCTEILTSPLFLGVLAQCPHFHGYTTETMIHAFSSPSIGQCAHHVIHLHHPLEIPNVRKTQSYRCRRYRIDPLRAACIWETKIAQSMEGKSA